MNFLSTMRFSRLLAVMSLLIIIPGCDQAKPSAITMEQGKIARIDDCHVKLDQIRVHPRDKGPIGDFLMACNVPESALKEKNWWGSQPEPLLFGMYVGDCIRVSKTFYCVRTIEPGASVTMEATYESKHADGALLQRIE
ncbi:MAG TPA: hypothetical protein PKA58_11015 [Polyangium sp.]|nr:hypothetical protein [Polyangium sp.]